MSPSFPFTVNSWGLLSGLRSLPISVSSLRPSTLTLHFHEVCGCCDGSIATPGHPYTQLHRRLVDFSSITADGGLTSRCRFCLHGSAGAKTKCQEKCAFSGSENHLSGFGVGFDHDAGMYVPCSDLVNPHCSRESEGSLFTLMVWWQLRLTYLLACCTWDP